MFVGCSHPCRHIAAHEQTPLEELTDSSEVSVMYGVILALYAFMQFVFSPVFSVLLIGRAIAGITSANMAVATASTPTSREARVPKMIRDRTSRPRSSVPSRCPAVPGGLKMFAKSVCSGAYGASHGAKAATTSATRVGGVRLTRDLPVEEVEVGEALVCAGERDREQQRQYNEPYSDDLRFGHSILPPGLTQRVFQGD